MDDSYYPVLPRYGVDGNFIDGDFPNDKIPFPKQGVITDENEINQSLLINLTSEKIDNNVIDDKSGNQNLGFLISDYKPSFDKKSLKPKKRKVFSKVKTEKNNGAF